MKLKLPLLFALTTAFISANAADVVITKHAPLLNETETFIYNPVLSNDGSKLCFSSEDYTGLKMYDFTSNVTTEISKEVGAGLYPIFSKDNSEVYYTTNIIKDKRTLRDVKGYNIKSKSSKEIAEPTRNVSVPAKCADGIKVSVNGKTVNTAKSAKSIAEPYVYAKGSDLILEINGITKKINPVENCVAYLWASVSPDQSKILVFAAGKGGAMVIDFSGKILATLGDYTTPVWYGNDYVVAAKTTDDGHVYTSSKIVLISADGKDVTDLTKSESMAMNPTASKEANRIVYNTLGGKMYEMQIEIK